MIRIAIVGFGTVGQGFAEVLMQKKGEIEKKIGKFSVVAVCDSRGSLIDENGVDLKKALDEKSKGHLSGKTAIDVIESVDFDCLVEVTTTDVYTGEPGLTHIKKALKSGRDVITSNKGPLIKSYFELMNIAERNGVKLMYEATVGGAMPIIKMAKNDLAGSEIIFIKGVLNGTCNYILSRMEQEKMTYLQVLSEAQELRIAEADPSYDVEGIDSAGKLVILASSLMGMEARFEDVEVTGITNVTPEAFEMAGSKNYTIRLIAEANKERKLLRVSPRLVPTYHPLAIRGTMNAVMIRTDLAGDVVVMGRGAGKYETASAILSDLIELYKTGSKA
jgi:homoserine dehydrogenase